MIQNNNNFNKYHKMYLIVIKIKFKILVNNQTRINLKNWIKNKFKKKNKNIVLNVRYALN